MVQVEDPRQELARRIYRGYEKDREDWRRDHLGASIIGRECLRELWYSFRWWTAPNFPGRVLRLFERGEKEEPWMVRDMRRAGLEVLDADPVTGEQFRMAACGGHFGGSCDGQVRRVPGGGDRWHIWECKTHGEKSFKQLASKGVKESKPEHFAQMQVYMLGFGFERALYTATNKNTDEIYVERVKFDRRFAEGLIAKAEQVIFSDEPNLRISDNPSWWKCKFCDHRLACHGDAQPERNCRTCNASTPNRDGSWTCDVHEKALDPAEQREGCDSWEAIRQDRYTTNQGEDR